MGAQHTTRRHPLVLCAAAPIAPLWRLGLQVCDALVQVADGGVHVGTGRKGEQHGRHHEPELEVACRAGARGHACTLRGLANMPPLAGL